MISVIIPTYKNKELLRQALKSIDKQLYSYYEIIVVDDTPDDSIDLVCEELCLSKLKYYHNIPSKGAIDNWNYGLSLAQGDKLILLHHDESFIHENFLERIDLLLDKYDIVIHNKEIMLSSGLKKDKIPEWIKKIIINMKYPLFSINVIGPCACLAVKKDCLVDFDNRMHWKVDIDWYYRVLRKARKIIYIDSKEIISQHGHEGQITNNINIKEVSAADSKIIKHKYKNIMVNFCLWIGKVISKFK